LRVTLSAVTKGCRLSAATVAVLLALGACSYSYVDSNNVRHVIGLVNVSITPTANEAPESTPSAVSVTSVGMHVYSGSPNGSGVVLGYAKETVLLMPNNACVDLQATSLCAASAKSNSNDVDGGARQP
jgi:hypothetical protein